MFLNSGPEVGPAPCLCIGDSPRGRPALEVARGVGVLLPVCGGEPRGVGVLLPGTVSCRPRGERVTCAWPCAWPWWRLPVLLLLALAKMPWLALFRSSTLLGAGGTPLGGPAGDTERSCRTGGPTGAEAEPPS